MFVFVGVDADDDVAATERDAGHVVDLLAGQQQLAGRAGRPLVDR
jgi:hypothetical protein